MKHEDEDREKLSDKVFPEKEIEKENQKGPNLKREIYFWSFLGLIFLLGVVLRIYLISDQVLLDDEWHPIIASIRYPFSFLLSHFTFDSRFIPINLYCSFLFKTIGLSEIMLRLPSLICGIMSLALFPLLIKKIFCNRVAIIFAFLFAVSPFLVFYSRYFRPYSMVVFFSFYSVLSLYLWLRDGKRVYSIIYIALGNLASYFHVLSLVSVLAPLGGVLLAKYIGLISGSNKSKLKIVPNFFSLWTVFLTTVFLILFLNLPPYLLSSLAPFLREGRISLDTLYGFVNILSGTSNKFMIIIFSGLLVSGGILLSRKKPLLFLIFSSIIITQFLVLIIILPGGINVPVVFSRYMIPIFPVCFVLMALGVHHLLEYFQSFELIKNLHYGSFLLNLTASLFLLSLFYTGPLLRIYTYPNNFTNHSAFQESYKLLDWKRSYRSNFSPLQMKKSDIPDFYKRFLNNSDDISLLEYPMLLGDHFNLYYYYQHFHKKKILVGYFSQLKLSTRAGMEIKEPLWGVYLPVDSILNQVPDTGKLLFGNMIDMPDFKGIEKRGVSYIILHKNLLDEMFPGFSKVKDYIYPPVLFLNKIYGEYWGPPVYEDKDVIVFKIKKK